MEKSSNHFRISEITLNDGTVLRPGRLTVLVGPNNAGKSRALKEIATWIQRGEPERGVVVSSVSLSYPSSLAQLRSLYNVERYQDDRGHWAGHALNPDLVGETEVNGGSWPSSQEERYTRRESDNFCAFFALNFGMQMVAFLTTQNRLQIVSEGPSGSRDMEAASLLQMLYNGGSAANNQVSDRVREAFGNAIALDFTVPQKLLLRVGDDFSAMPSDPRDARPIMQKHERLDEQGDGIRSYVGIVVALLLVKRDVFLIDEPEAFLHPPQAFRVGALIAKQANESRQTVIATHSADVLRGILSQMHDVDIVRIDRVGNVNTFRQLDIGSLKGVINDPLLTSSRVLDGLFYSGAVVVEADSDARFYHAVSRKLPDSPDLHFVNADNKQTVSRVVRLYKEMGVRAVGIVDFDVLNDRTELEKSLNTFGFSDDDVAELLQIQETIAKAVKEASPDERLANVQAKLDEVRTKLAELAAKRFTSPEEERKAKDGLLRQMESRFHELAETAKVWKAVKQAGRSALTPETKLAFDDLWEQCASLGLFINPCGELEAMLTGYGVASTTDKKAWITKALQLMPGLSPDDTKYPWRFLHSVHEYITARETPGPPPDTLRPHAGVQNDSGGPGDDVPARHNHVMPGHLGKPTHSRF